MNAAKEIERHRLPCGPMSVSIEGVCRRRLRDHFDSLLDRLTQETHPEGVDEETLEVDETELPKEKESKETDEQMKDRLLREGKIKAEVKRELQQYEEPEETGEEAKQRLVEEGKMKLDVKKELSKYEKEIGLKDEESNEGKKQRLIQEGKMKEEVRHHVGKHKEKIQEETKEPPESDDDKKKRMIKEGKLNVDVKKSVKRYEDKVMPKPKSKTSDHSEYLDEEDEKNLMGNSKMLQDPSGKIKKR